MSATPNAQRSEFTLVGCWNDVMQAAYAFFTRTWMPAFLAIAVLALLAPAQAYANTLSLPVAASGNWATTKSDWTHSIAANCGNTLPTPEGFFKGKVIVGYDYYYDPGTQPIPCWMWASTAYRGYVRFNLTQVKQLPINTYIKSARLVWSENEPVVSKSTRASNVGECVKGAYVAKTSWNHFAIPGIAVPMAFVDGGHDVTTFVKQWASGKMANHGFFFVGTDESLPAKTNKACNTFLYNIALKVVIAKKKVMHVKDAMGPPKILAPAPNHLFVHQDVDAQVRAALKHPNPGRWEYEFEWQRADYHTKANNHYARPNPKPNDWPLVLGQFSPFRAWQSTATLAENGSVSTLHVSFSAMRSHRLDSSYEYRFRVRERLKATKAHGPWSGWRSFIVSELVPAAGPLTRPRVQVPQSERQRQLPNRAQRPLMHIRHSIRRLPERKPTTATDQKPCRSSSTTPC